MSTQQQLEIRRNVLKAKAAAAYTISKIAYMAAKKAAAEEQNHV